MIGYSVYGHDNDTFFFEGRADVARCDACGHLLKKWKERLDGIPIGNQKYDIGYSYDGVLVVSERFRQLYESSGMTGLRFRPLLGGFYSVRPVGEVAFDAERRRTKCLNQCPKCGFYEAVIGASPVFLKPGSVVPDNGFRRTDIEFGSGDQKHPLVLCGKPAGAALNKARLRGLDLEVVE